ncbi:hypothetical protein HFU84_05165 [Acidithiobacillus sp. CV18-2]|nr:hypothetical protein [Acidithiobacillus sp. CV18-3]MBU2758494.1 hypothetical protein [Acidithiobacillus sp. BN09-2]MBU2776906.1 hypothetical protein [Acidithiobacillus sp. CV18-2]MBU2799254.1 hypothetical protein [Acidithiobacillus sp. VAN18-4]
MSFDPVEALYTPNYEYPEHVIDDELSKSIVYITLSAYYAGVIPLIRIEQALNLAKGMNNEYAFALAARTYIEVGGRVHKGIRLWRVFDKDRTQLAQLHNGTLRLLGRYTPEGKEHLNIFKAKGFNVMSFVQALSDEVPDIAQVYENLSSYVHGGFGEQRFYRMQSWLAHAKGEHDPTVGGWSDYLDQLRKTVFSDFDLLLNVTRVIRQRYDESRETD